MLEWPGESGIVNTEIEVAVQKGNEGSNGKDLRFYLFIYLEFRIILR